MVARAAFEDPAVLMQQMQQEGLVLTRRALGRVNDPSLENQVCALFYVCGEECAPSVGVCIRRCVWEGERPRDMM